MLQPSPKANPIRKTFKVRNGEALLEVDGWETSYTLGIYRTSNETYASAMLMSGLMLADGFATLKQAHAFNRLVMGSKLFTGTPFLEEFHRRGGGQESARKLVDQLKQKAMKNE